MAKKNKEVEVVVEKETVEVKVVCDVCHGAGQDPEGVTCSACGGKGYL